MSTEAALRSRVLTGFRRLADYRGIAKESVLDKILDKAREFRQTQVVHLNATSFGGGVAEILSSFVLLMNDIGVRTDWRVLYGTPEFFEVTKKMHNALQGKDVAFSEEEIELYRYTNERFARFAILDQDVVVIHDPQPCALVRYAAHASPWVWRCHIDITHPNQQAWELIRPFIEQYDQMVVSAEVYRRPDIQIPQRIISLSIDPLSPKNMELTPEVIQGRLKEADVPTDRPLITQVSRFDPWKDPEGVLKVFLKVKAEVDCRLAFVYNMASDDPEGVKIYNQMLEVAKPHLRTGDVLFVRGDDPVLVNAMQRASSVIIQKSTREGFGLTVTEAMWKGTPVVASNVGGIPTQLQDGVTGYLVDPHDLETFTERIVTLLKDRDLAGSIGRRAKEHVRDRFLITRHLLDYLNLMGSL